MRYGSICSGIEAATVAWEALGWTPAFFSEIDPFCSELLAQRHPGVPNHGDFTKLLDLSHPVHQGEPIDVLVGGTPCQDFSVAGLRAGIEGARGGLTLDFCRLVDVLRPRWVVWENVPGVLSSDGGRALGAFTGALAELGYGFAWRVLDAQYFGLAQRRKRVFVVGHAGGEPGRPASVLFEPEGMRGHPAPRRQAREGLAVPAEVGAPDRGLAGGEGVAGDGLSGSPGEGRAVAFYPNMGPKARTDGASVELGNTLSGANGGNKQAVALVEDGPSSGVEAGFCPEISNTLGSCSGGFRTTDLDGSGAFIVNIEHGLSASGNLHARQISEPLTRSEYKGHSVVFTSDGLVADPISANEGKTYTHEGVTFRMHNVVMQDPVCMRESGQGYWMQDDVTGTLDASMGRSGHANRVCTMVQPPSTKVRRLTPRECERLQGFPDDYTQICYKKGQSPDSQRYRALGNSMAVPVMRWIGQRIQKVESIDLDPSGSKSEVADQSDPKTQEPSREPMEFDLMNAPHSSLLCVIDTETTGLPDNPDAQVIEVAATLWDLARQTEVRAWSTLVRPTTWGEDGRRCAKEICGIDPDLVDEQGEDPVLARMKLFDFARGATLHAWNSVFDEEMVRRMDPRQPHAPNRWGPCLMREFSTLSRGDADLRSKLVYAVEQCGFDAPEDAHRALVDARMAAKVICHVRKGGALTGRLKGPTAYKGPGSVDPDAPSRGGKRRWTAEGLVILNPPTPQE